MNRGINKGNRDRLSAVLFLACALGWTSAACESQAGNDPTDSLSQDAPGTDRGPDGLLPDQEDRGEVGEDEEVAQNLLEQRDQPDESEPLPVNCGSGWISCKAGIMTISASGHIASWGDCEEDGYSWPCLSGSCGPYDLCQDDHDALIKLLTPPIEWKEASLSVTDETAWPGDALWCKSHACTWTLTSDQGEAILLLKLTPGPIGSSSSIETTPVAGATNLVASKHTQTSVTEAEVNGAPADIVGLTLWWAPMPFSGMESPTPPPNMGLSAGVEMVYPNGDKTTLVWRLRATPPYPSTDAPVEYAIQGAVAIR